MRGTFKRLCGCITVLFALTASAPGSVDAYDSGRLTVNRFGQRGLPGLHSAHTLGVGAMTVGVFGNGTLDQDFLKKSRDWLPYHVPPMFDTTLAENPAISLFNVNPFIGIGIADFFDVSAMLPLHIDMIGSYQEVGPGDMQITFKLGTHSGVRTPVFDLGFLSALVFPTGSREKGVFPRHPYYFNKDSLAARPPRALNEAYFSSQNVDFETHLLMALDLGALKQPVPISFQFDYGMHFATKVGHDNAVLMSAALACQPVNSLTFAAVFDAEMRHYNFTHGFTLNNDPFHITPCVVVTPKSGFIFTLGSAISLAGKETFTYVKSRAPGDSQQITTGIEPRWNVFVQVGWSGIFTDRDRDKDGIVDRYDECPAVPEDVDGFRDDDGCPDADNDGDEMQDSLDKCPDKAEDRDGVRDDDGCPEDDNDGDKIQDSLDQCPNYPEDYDGFNERDGCPDYDNDRDGVRDSVDRCPVIPEDLDGFQDNDGCPDIDNDRDGVADSLDKCPDKAGSPDNAGCAAVEQPKPPVPKTKEIKRGRVVLRRVNFIKGSAAIDAASFEALDEVARSLADWPLVQIEIQGHTDNQGSARSRLNLSTARAEAVRAYLINKGVAPSRLTAVGKSDSSPLGDNASKAGRAVNNRIELRRIDP
ncbi:MAG: OmpA family protein [Chitinispirillaceae bacterium]|nr:OmpA family protein [Chitinispirillaceae bacterium]